MTLRPYVAHISALSIWPSRGDCVPGTAGSGRGIFAGTRGLPRLPQRDSSFLRAVLRFLAGQLFGSESAKTRQYPVLYLLHGLGGNEQSMAVAGEWTALQDLRRDHKVGDFLVVAPDGWDTFYINSRDGKTPLRRFLPSRIHAVHRAHLPCADRNAPPAASPVFPWEATERCASLLRIRNCSARSALIARR